MKKMPNEGSDQQQREPVQPIQPRWSQPSAEPGAAPAPEEGRTRPRWEQGGQAWEEIYAAEMSPKPRSKQPGSGRLGAAVQAVGAAGLGQGPKGRKGHKRSKRKKTWFDYLLNVLILVLILVGLYYLLRPYYVRWQRGRVADELRQSLDDGSLKKIPYDPKAYLLQSPEYDVYDVLGDGSLIEGDGLSNTEVTPGLAYLTPLGTLQIPKMELNTPIIAEMDYGAMFYGASHWDETPMPGEPGNSVMLLHRTRYADYDFYDVDKLQERDVIGVIRNGKQYSFEIVQIKSILPDKLITTLKSEYKDGGSYITLVTCDPPNISSHRLLVTAKLVSTRDVQKNK